MQGEDMPQATNRIDLDPDIRDVHGLPVARITYEPHRHELAASAYYGPKLEAILHEAGALWARTATSPHVGGSSEPDPSELEHPCLASRHRHRPHGHRSAHLGRATSGGASIDVPNVVICDSSPFPDRSGLRADADARRPVDPQFSAPLTR